MEWEDQLCPAGATIMGQVVSVTGVALIFAELKDQVALEVFNEVKHLRL